METEPAPPSAPADAPAPEKKKGNGFRFGRFLRANLLSSVVLAAVFALFIVTIVDASLDTLMTPVLNKLVGNEINSINVDVLGLTLPLGRLFNAALRLLVVATIVYWASGRPDQNIVREFI